MAAVCLAMALALAAQDLTPANPLKEYIYLGGRLIAVETLFGTNGTARAPFATLSQWNRLDLSQFTKTDVGTWTGSLSENLRTTQPDTTYTVIPAFEWTALYGSQYGTAPRYRFLVSNNSFSPSADEDLVIEADVHYNSWTGEKHGVGCFDPGNSTNNFYVVARSNNAYQVNKVINGTTYPQMNSTYPVGTSPSFKSQKVRLRMVLSSSGALRVYAFGQVIADLPMTLSNATVVKSCKVGFVASTPDVANSSFSFSRLRVFRAKLDAEQLF